ncbi:MAG: hypothetical protein D6707_09720, partial [Bacteroidetes bacterium]
MKRFFFLLFVTIPYLSVADTLLLQPFSVIDSNVYQIPSQTITFIDSAEISRFKNSNITELLKYTSPVFFKEYGNGALATPSFRGTAARHTKVFWNGLPLNSSMLGTLDFNLLPVLNYDKISVKHGLVSGISMSAGALGGIIDIRNQAKFQPFFSAEIRQEAGSFDTYNSYFSVRKSNAKVFLSSAVTLKKSDNDFSYRNYTKPQNPWETQQNARIMQTGGNQIFSVKLKNNAVLHTFVNAFYSNRQIPAALTDTLTKARQEDIAVRGGIQYRKHFANSYFESSVGVVADWLDYTDSVKNIFSENRSTALVSSGNYTRWFSSKAKMQTGWLVRYAEAFASTGYKELKQQAQTGVFAGLEYYVTPKLLATSYLRQEMNDFRFFEPLPALGLVYRKNTRLNLRFNYARMFNFPTLNDLYWKPGGNPDLLPEKGYSVETGMHITFLKIIQWNNTLYYGEIDNWIQWTPDATGTFTAQNIKSVEQKGVESSLSINYRNAFMQMKIQSIYAYTSTVNKSSYQGLSSIVGKQLIYVPQHSLRNVLLLNFNKIIIGVEHFFTDERYITTDNSWYLPYYNLWNM